MHPFAPGMSAFPPVKSSAACLPACNQCSCAPPPCRYVTDPDMCTTYYSSLTSNCTMDSPFYLEYDCTGGCLPLPQQVRISFLSL